MAANDRNQLLNDVHSLAYEVKSKAKDVEEYLEIYNESKDEGEDVLKDLWDMTHESLVDTEQSADEKFNAIKPKL